MMMESQNIDPFVESSTLVAKEFKTTPITVVRERADHGVGIVICPKR